MEENFVRTFGIPKFHIMTYYDIIYVTQAVFIYKSYKPDFSALF